MTEDSCPPHVPMEFPGGAYPIMTFRDVKPEAADKYPSFSEDPETEFYFGKLPPEHELPPLIGRVWICSRCKLLYFNGHASDETRGQK